MRARQSSGRSVSIRERVVREAEDVRLHLIDLEMPDGAEREPGLRGILTPPDVEGPLESQVAIILVAVLVEVVIGVLVPDLQLRGTLRVEAQSRRLEIENQPAQIGDRDRDENGVVDGER